MNEKLLKIYESLAVMLDDDFVVTLSTDGTVTITTCEYEKKDYSKEDKPKSKKNEEEKPTKKGKIFN